jgi:hypothetical protein
MQNNYNTTKQRPSQPAAGWAQTEQIGQQYKKAKPKMDWIDKISRIQGCFDSLVMEIPCYSNLNLVARSESQSHLWLANCLPGTVYPESHPIPVTIATGRIEIFHSRRSS